MQNKKSIWNKEITLSSLLSRRPEDAARWAVFVCVGLFITYPLVFGALCLIHHNIEYTVLTHPKIVQTWIWPLSALAGAAAILITCAQARRQGKRLFPWVRNNPVFLCFSFLVLWMLLSTCGNGWNVICLYGDEKHLRFESLFNQLGYFLILFPAATLVQDESKKLTLARLHEAVSLFLALAAFVLWKTQSESALISGWRPSITAIYSNINYYAYYLSISIPLSAAMFIVEARPGMKVFSAIVLAVNTVVLSLNNTMGGWVACAVAMVFLLVARWILIRRIDWKVLLIAAIFAICLYLPGHLRGTFERNTTALFTDIVKITTQAEGAERAGSWRWLIWKRGLALIAEHPVLGLGFEGVYVRGLDKLAHGTRIHNEFLQYALFYGIPAGIAYFSGCLGVFLRALRRRVSLTPITLACLTAAFGYLVSSFFGLTLFATAPFLFLFLGMGYVQKQ